MGAGFVVDGGAVERHVLPVRLHRELLQVGGEPSQVLIVRQDRDRLRAEEVGVPDGEEAHEDGQVSIARRRSEMLAQ